MHQVYFSESAFTKKFFNVQSFESQNCTCFFLTDLSFLNFGEFSLKPELLVVKSIKNTIKQQSLNLFTQKNLNFVQIQNANRPSLLLNYIDRNFGYLISLDNIFLIK